MALQFGTLNQALRRAGVDEDLARAAAKEVAYEHRFAAVERQIGELRTELWAEFRFQRWVNATTLGVVLAVLVKLFVH